MCFVLTGVMKSKPYVAAAPCYMYLFVLPSVIMEVVSRYVVIKIYSKCHLWLHNNYDYLHTVPRLPVLWIGWASRGGIASSEWERVESMLWPSRRGTPWAESRLQNLFYLIFFITLMSNPHTQFQQINFFINIQSTVPADGFLSMAFSGNGINVLYTMGMIPVAIALCIVLLRPWILRLAFLKRPAAIFLVCFLIIFSFESWIDTVAV